MTGARGRVSSSAQAQFRMRHAGYFGALEEQMTQMSHEGYQGTGSPDRVDAAVYALSELAMPKPRIGIVRECRYRFLS